MFYDHWSILQPSEKGSTKRYVEYFVAFAFTVYGALRILEGFILGWQSV